ncbi:hypothetical protein [Bacillus sp. T33-2]|uniref:hypothetical protein n=1 Tax=Bacillus sp. T33-2 TaxID=2054168 RepID=UPI000C777278|nr:hypothetical protein [Bacillus sp. T33-2]PLR99598.1 hypothetical protein CVD19_00615 [Bacillus sp. T33-2]
MARKPVEIELDKCIMLESTLKETAFTTPDLYGKIIDGRGNKLIGLKGDVKKLIKEAIKKYEGYTVELFGKVKFCEEEKENIKYLKTLI